MATPSARRRTARDPPPGTGPGPELVNIGDGPEGTGHVVLGLPETVGIGLVEEERRHLLPPLVRILGQRHRLVGGDGGGAGVWPTKPLHLVPIERPDLRNGRNEPVGDAGRPLSGHPAATSERDGRSTWPERSRGEAHGATLVLERLTGERRSEVPDHLGDPPAPLVHGYVEQGELLVDVAAGHDQVDPPLAQDVQHDQVLGHTQRVVEGGDQRGDHEPDAGGPGRHGRQHRQRAGQVPVRRCRDARRRRWTGTPAGRPTRPYRGRRRSAPPCSCRRSPDCGSRSEDRRAWLNIRPGYGWVSGPFGRGSSRAKAPATAAGAVRWAQMLSTTR